MKPLLKVLQGNVIKAPPCWLMRQAGRHLKEYRVLRSQKSSFLDFCLSPKLAAKATLQPVGRYDIAAAIIFSDILIIPHALGQAVEFIENKGPVLDPLLSLDRTDRLNWGGTEAVIGRVCEALELVKPQLSPSVALIGFAGAPWTLACYMIEGGASRDFNKVKLFALRWPDAFQDLLDRLALVTAEYLIAQVKAGADALQLFDSWAGAVPASHFHDWVIGPTKRIVKKLKESCPGVPLIGFPRRCGASYRDYYEQTGVDALSLDETINLTFVRRELGSKAILQGALDPALLVVGGAPLKREVERQLKILNTGPYIFNLGHGVLPETPPGHVEDLIRFIQGSGE